MTARFVASIAAMVIASAPVAWAQGSPPPPPPPTIASLGTCALASGASIPDCRIAYREFGHVNPNRNNTVLVTTWLLGRSDDWLGLLGPDGFVDTTRFHVLIVDALGDGQSSSPSNSGAAAAKAFADLTVGDMVVSQYRLLTERLGIQHLRAVVGFSMGGMQAIEWAVRYPKFADRIVSIAGAARVGSFDRAMWTAMLNAIADGRRAGTPPDSVWSRLAHLEMLFVQTPAGINATTEASIDAEIGANAKAYRSTWKLEDYEAQLRAIRSYDVTRDRGGDLRVTAQQVTAPLLAVYSWDDHMVTASSVAEFARLARAETLAVRSSCGHVTLFCERARVAPVIRAFIASSAGTSAHVLGPDSSAASRQPTSAPALLGEIARADSVLFAAFNDRDVNRLMSFFTPDVEFYQDNEGVENWTQTKRDFVQMFAQQTPIRRELVPGSLEVFPIRNYGAMEVGRHRFCHVENGQEECGTFSFVHIWRRTTHGWRIARIVSYGH